MMQSIRSPAVAVVSPTLPTNWLAALSNARSASLIVVVPKSTICPQTLIIKPPVRSGEMLIGGGNS